MLHAAIADSKLQTCISNLQLLAANAVISEYTTQCSNTWGCVVQKWNFGVKIVYKLNHLPTDLIVHGQMITLFSNWYGRYCIQYIHSLNLYFIHLSYHPTYADFHIQYKQHQLHKPFWVCHIAGRSRTQPSCWSNRLLPWHNYKYCSRDHEEPGLGQ